MTKEILKVEDLRVIFEQDEAVSVGVNEVSFTVREGVNLALVGESGSGKSVTSLSCMRLLGNNARIDRGRIFFEGQDITHFGDKEMKKIRGARMSMIFQEPMTSLNPVLSIGYQLAESLHLHTQMNKKQIKERCLELLRQVGIADVEKVLSGFPHELSGGMRQRVMIAMSIACNLRLLIADEPTTALDVTIQAQILTLLKKLQREMGITLLIITHDFGVVAEMADEVVVMYAGFAVEKGKVLDVFAHPLHPYTEGLLRSIIPLDASTDVSLYYIPGMVPRINLKQECCPFYDRCPYQEERCTKKLPKLTERNPDHFVRCFIGENAV